MDFLRFTNGLRRSLSTLMLMAMLALACAPLLAAFPGTPESCGMKCCRAKKLTKCCCHKSRKSSGPTAAITARSCPPGCGQYAPSTFAPALGLNALTHLVLPAAETVGTVSGYRPFVPPSYSAFALQQRPPPPFLSHS